MAAAGAQPNAAQGAPFVWDRGGATFNWGDAANWNPDGVPGSSVAPSTGADDTVTFSDLTAANVGTIDLGAVGRAVAQVTISGDTPSAYSLTNGTLVTPLISRASPDQNNFLQSVAVTVPASNLEVNNTGTASFFNIQGRITAPTFTHTGNATGRTVLGLAAGLTSADNNVVSNWVITGGILETRSVAGATPYNSLGSGAVSLGAATLDLRGDASFNFGNSVTLTGNGTINVNRSGTTATGQTLTLGPINMGANSLTVTGGNTYTLSAGVTTFSANPTFNPTTANLTLASLDAGAGSPARTVTKTGPGLLTVTGAGANFTGTTTASVIGGLSLGNTAALGSPVTYNLTTATGVNHPEVRVTAAAGANPGDVFNVPPGGIIAGSPAFLGSLTIGGNLQIASGPADDAIIAQTAAGGNNMVGNLPTTPTYLFGIAQSHSPGTVTIGPGTPWEGISSDRTGPGGVATIKAFQTGTIETNGDFFLQGLSTANAGGDYRLALGNGAGTGSVTITPATATTAIVRNGRVQLDDNTPVFNGNLTFDIQTGAVVQLIHNASLGTNAAVADNARIIARSGGSVDPNGATTLSGNVSLRQGSLLQLNDVNNLAGGIGVFTQEAGAVTQVQNATALGGAGSPGTVPGSVLRLEVNDISSLDAKRDLASNLVVFGGNRTIQSVTLNSAPGVEIPLPNGGTTPTGALTNDASNRSPTNTAVTAVTTITIGSGGGVLAATTGTTLTLAAISGNTSGGWVINGPGNTLQIGSTGTVEGLAKGGTVVITGGDTTATNPSTYGITVGRVNIVGGARLQNLSGGMPYNIGTAGQGVTSVSSGSEFRSQTGTTANTALVLAGGSFARFQGGTATVGSIAGAGSVVIGPFGTADTTNRTLRVGHNDLSTEHSGVISQNNGATGNGSLIKLGSGSLILSGDNTYQGTTSIGSATNALVNNSGAPGNNVNEPGGSLLVNGTHGSAAAPVGNYTVTGTAQGPATLGGRGTIHLADGNSVTAAGSGANLATISPGTSVGTLTVNTTGPGTVGGVAFADASNFLVETLMPGVAGVANDLLVVSGPGGNLSMATTNDTLSLISSDPGTFIIAQYSGTRTGIFDVVSLNGVAEPGTESTVGTTTTWTASSGNVSVIYDDAAKNIQATVVPEPATASVLAVAALGLLARRRRAPVR